MDRLTEILDSIAGPLHLASKDDFSHLPKIRGLEGLITRLTEEAMPISPDPSIHDKLRDIQETFIGFDDVTGSEKEARIARGRHLLDEIKGLITSEETVRPYRHGEISPVLNTSVRFVKGV